MASQAQNQQSNVSFEAVRDFLYKPSKKIDKKTKFFAVLVGRPQEDGRRPPFIVDTWAACKLSTDKFKHSKLHANLTRTQGVYFKSFKNIQEAVRWTVEGFVTSAREQLLSHVASLQ